MSLFEKLVRFFMPSVVTTVLLFFIILIFSGIHLNLNYFQGNIDVVNIWPYSIKNLEASEFSLPILSDKNRQLFGYFLLFLIYQSFSCIAEIACHLSPSWLVDWNCSNIQFTTTGTYVMLLPIFICIVYFICILTYIFVCYLIELARELREE